MALIEGIRIQNYCALRDVTLGRIGTIPEYRDAEALTPLTVVIGKNGAGKSSIFDAFGFLVDCMEKDIESACNARGRGGFDKLISSGKESENISITVYYRESHNDRPITYEVSIGRVDDDGLPIVKTERLRQRPKSNKRGKPLSFLYLDHGKGSVWIGDEAVEGDNLERKDVELDPHRLAIASLAEQVKENPRIAKFKRFIRSWYLSYFTPDAARQIPQAGMQEHLNLHADNVGNFVQYLARKHEPIFRKILENISEKIPGIGRIEPYRDEVTNNLYLLFRDKGFSKPFNQRQMSDGTLKMLCYLLLIYDPNPAPFICIEEPENGLYHQLVSALVNELRDHATGRKNSSQIFITTHQPYLVDAMQPEEVWILKKGENGFSSIQRVSEIPYVKEMVAEGQPLGALWYSDYLD